MPKPWRCPHCRSRSGVPVRYGLPTREHVAAAARGELVLGGCVLGDDDPPRCCLGCRAALWPRGVFAVPGAADDPRVILHRAGRRRLEVAVGVDFEVTVEWRDRAGPTEPALRIPGHLFDVLVLVLTLDLTTDGATLTRWLGRRGLAFVGDLTGAIDTFGVTDDGMVSFTSHRGDLLLHTSLERYVLQLVWEAYRRNGYRSIIEFRDWLSSIGLEIVSAG